MGAKKVVERVAGVAAGMVVVLAAGCARPEAPSVGIRGVRPDQMYWNMATMVVVADVINRDERALNFDRADYALEVNGRELASGRYRGAVSVPAGGRREVSFPIEISYLKLLDAVRDGRVLRGGETVQARLSGKMRFGGGLGFASVPFGTTVEIPLNQRAWGGRFDAPLGAPLTPGGPGQGGPQGPGGMPPPPGMVR